MVLVGYRGSKKQGHEVYLLCYIIDRYKEENFNIFYNSMTSKILTGAVIDNLINDRRYIKGKFTVPGKLGRYSKNRYIRGDGINRFHCSR